MYFYIFLFSLLFFAASLALFIVSIMIFLKKEFITTSRNTRYWFLSWLLNSPILLYLLVPNAYDPETYHLKGWKKNVFGIILIILAIACLYTAWQLVLYWQLLSRITY